MKSETVLQILYSIAVFVIVLFGAILALFFPTRSVLGLAGIVVMLMGILFGVYKQW
jgi:cadmium resistance protein CadD (predicted permease)